MRSMSRLALAVALAVAGPAAFAAGRGVQSAPRTRPNANQVSAFALPKPSGLTAPFPAGLSEGSGAARSTDPVASNSAPIPVDTAVNGNAVSNVNTTTNGMNTAVGTGGTVGVNNGFNNGSASDVTNAAVATTVLGAGAGVAGPSQNPVSGAGGYSATDIARFFYYADTDHDGSLTEAEYNRLPVKPLSFQQMDRNFDGVISRFEFEDAFR